MKVLFITSTRIGDAVLSTALLSHLSTNHPEAEFTVACGPVAAPLFSETPHVVKIIALEKRRASLHWFDLWLACCTSYWDLVVDLRASALSYFLMTRRRMVWRNNNSAEHRLVSLAGLAGLGETPAPQLWTSAAQRDAAEKLLPGDKTILALGPTANWPGKQWPGERFAELALRLTAEDGILPGAWIVILGAASERREAATAIEALPIERVIDLVGRLDLLTASALLARAGLYIGNDSGLMHIAAASGAPTLGLFGPSKEAHYAPWGPHTAVVRTALGYDDLVGGPGYDHRTTGSLMESLSVDMAEDGARKLWAKIA
ncbi:MAG: glycosyltransferase family 9 protein [Rhodospirillaceae bacterium]|nr:glycosyltransferase family 9 protein [Rhodospirillaceae bacterium]MBT3927861.1 glycosyltransferase family 9 protein [Rhodospirillaceae bacterium]MBT5677797.1 glycosyltransferase family 9 protein [Rhodospirillaceae bacterium]MBT6828047.1 glycosyltransferase family 9 protein [Rhodospirillaceae bacterium]